MIDFRELVKAGVHFGHQRTRWCPKMAPYIWGFKNNVHLIDVSKTAVQLEKAATFLRGVAAEGKSILWVGTKKSARDIIVNTATSLNMPYVYHRWVGGTLSNKDQVRKSVTKLLHYEDVLAKADRFPHYTKKEFNVFSKMVERLTKNVGGIRNLHWPLGAVVLVDINKENSALKEATIMGIPVVAIVDTNGDPTGVDIVIPGNDDAPRAIALLVEYLAAATAKGVEMSKQKPNAKAAQAQQEQPAAEQLLVRVEGVDEDEIEEVGAAARAASRGAKKKSDAVSATLDSLAKTVTKKDVMPEAPVKVEVKKPEAAATVETAKSDKKAE